MHARPAVAFRVDSGASLGSGHVMRCLALALELQRRRANVVFVSRDHAGHISNRVEAEGFEVLLLPMPGGALVPDGVATTLGASEARDAQETMAVLDGRRPDWVVADHYEIGEAWERAVRSCGSKVLVIDDLANRTHDPDLLLDTNFLGTDEPNRYHGLVPERCVTLFGPRFALLHPEYAVMRRVLPARDGRRLRVLVSFGGSDSTNETATALAALSRPEFSDGAVDVVLGPNHPAPDEIVQAAGRRHHTTVHRNLSSLAGLGARADFSIGAAGSTNWERLCLDLPSAVVTVADNQVVSTRALAAAGYVCWIGSTPTTARDYVEALSQPSSDLRDLPPLVDGLGSKRVAEALCPSTTAGGVLRRARPDDAALFFDWRNEPGAREQSFAQDPISWASHRTWFQGKIRNAASAMFVGESEGLPIGQARLDFDGGEGVLSYSVDSTVRGRGWGGWLVSEVMRRVRSQDGVVHAYVREANTASRRIFTRLGWRETSQHGRIEYHWTPSPETVGESR